VLAGEVEVEVEIGIESVSTDLDGRFGIVTIFLIGVELEVDLDSTAARVAFAAQLTTAVSVASHMIMIPLASMRIELKTVAVGTSTEDSPVTVKRFVMCSPRSIELRQ